MTTTFRAGDAVFHRPTGEEWLLAWAENSRVSACGWPETIAEAADCELVQACSDEKHVEMLRTWAVRQDNDYRSRVCRRQLAAWEAAR